jgi:hypothetical protein
MPNLMADGVRSDRRPRPGRRSRPLARTAERRAEVSFRDPTEDEQGPGTVDQAGAAQQRPPPIPGGPVEEPSAPRRSRKRTLALLGIGIATVILALGVIGYLSSSGGGELPDRLGGIQGGSTDFTSRLEAALKGTGGFSWDAAVYADKEQIRYRVLVSDGAPSGPLDAQRLVAAIPGDALYIIEGGAALDLSRAISETRDGVLYVCAPGAWGDQFERETYPEEVTGMTACVFKGRFLGMVGTSHREDVAGLMDIAQELYQAVA